MGAWSGVAGRGAPSSDGLCGYICNLEWGPGKEQRGVERRALTGYVCISATWSGSLVRSSGRGAPSSDGLCLYICQHGKKRAKMLLRHRAQVAGTVVSFVY